MYNKDEVLKECLQYFNGDTLAANVLIEKYLLKDIDGNYLEKSPKDIFKRLTKEFKRIEDTYPNPLSEEEIYKAFDGFKYIIPQGSPLFGIGNTAQVTSIANCFVVDSPVDSYGGILKTDEELAQIMKRRGGVGVDISTLRPKGTTVNNAARTSDGITCFMERFSNTTKEVAQNGRRGALIETISCMHPDIEDFICAKRNLKKITGANISVKWNDEFMKAVEENKEVILRFPVDCKPENAQITKKANAKAIWDKFIEANWESAEPGCLFWDTLTRNSLSDCYDNFKTVSTNPCITADTLIITNKGSIPIIDIINNGIEQYKILTYNIKTSKVEFETIINGEKTRDNADIIQLELEDGTILKLTPDHKVFTKNRGYIKASQLTESDIILQIK